MEIPKPEKTDWKHPVPEGREAKRSSWEQLRNFLAFVTIWAMAPFVVLGVAMIALACYYLVTGEMP